MNEKIETIKSSILDSLDKAKTALNNKEVSVETLKVSEIPDYIRQIELNKIKLTVNCSEFESGTIKATKDGKTRTGNVQDGQCIIMLPSTGTWHIEHDLGDYVETEVNGDTSVELVKKKVTFSEGECSEEKITIHVNSVTGNNSNDNFIRVKKNGVVIEVQAQLKGSDIEITNFEYEDGATYTIEYVIKNEVRGSIEVKLVDTSNFAGEVNDFFENIEGVSKGMYNVYQGIPKNIVFTDQKAPQDAKLSNWTKDGKNGVVKWRDTSADTLYISTQETGKKIILPESCRGLFTGNNKEVDEFFINRNTETIDLLNVDSSNVLNMSGMFCGLSKLTEIKNLQLLNTSKVTDMSYMFQNCNIIEQLDLSNFNIENVTTTNYMFDYCKKLTTIYANEWNNIPVSNSSSMFSACDLLPGKNQTNDISMAKWKENGGYFTNPAEKGS